MLHLMKLQRTRGERPSSSTDQAAASSSRRTIAHKLTRARFPFLFIVAYGRSGSTLLMGLLNSLPGYCIRGENNSGLFSIFEAVGKLRATKAKYGKKAGLSTHPWYGAGEMAVERFARDCADAFVRSVLQPPPGARCVGFKEIRYTDAEMEATVFVEYLDFLNWVFPGSAFLFNVRNVEETVKSGWWKDRDSLTVSRMLSNAQRRFLSYAQRSPDRSFVVDYDRLVQEQGYFRTVCDFLGESFDGESVAAVLATRHSVTSRKAARVGGMRF